MKFAFHKPVPTLHAAWEILLMRLGFAVLLWLRLPAGAAPSTQPSPNGLAQYFDLTFLSHASVFEPLRWCFLVMLLLYVSGRGMVLALPCLLAVNVAFFTLGNSQGWIGHLDQIISLVLLVQTLFHLSLFFIKNRTTFSIGDLEIFYTHQTIAAVYVVAGLTKLIKTGGTWIAQLPNITVQIVKTNDQFFYDTLSHPNPGLADWLNQLIIAHPWVAGPLFAPGLLVELAAFFIPYGRKPALILGIILLGMHALINVVMQITFTTNIALIVIYLLNVPWLLVLAFRYCKGAGRDAGK